MALVLILNGLRSKDKVSTPGKAPGPVAFILCIIFVFYILTQEVIYYVAAKIRAPTYFNYS